MNDGSHHVDAFLAGDMTDEQGRQLEAWLQEDPRNVEQFATACLLENQLAEIVGQRQLQKSALALGRAASPLTPAASPSRTWWATASSGCRGLIKDFSREPLAVAILVLVMISGGVLFWNLSRLVPQQPAVVQQPSGEPGASAPGGVVAEKNLGASQNDPSGEGMSRPVVARLARTVNAQWGAAAMPADGAALKTNQKLKLKQGLAEITFNSGATVILEGPAELEIGGRNSEIGSEGSEDSGDNVCSLALGKLFARVPQQAHGFTVHTPSMKIVDLGTEFGVEVKLEVGTRNVERGTKQSDPRSTFRVPHSSSTRVQVYRGEVAIGPAADAIAQAPAEKPAMILRAGEGATTDADGQSPRKIQANATVFVREFPEKVADSAATIVIDNFRAGEDFSTSSPRVVSYVGDGPLGGHREIIVQTIQGTNTTSLSTREGALSVQTTGSADTNVNWGTMDQGNSSQLDLAIPDTWCMQLEFTAFHMETNIRRGGIWLRIRDGKGVMFDYAVAETELDNLKAQNGGVLSVPLSRFMNSTTYNGEVDGVTFTFDDQNMRGTVTEVRFVRPEEAQRNPKPGLHDQNKLQENARQSKLR